MLIIHLLFFAAAGAQAQNNETQKDPSNSSKDITERKKFKIAVLNNFPPFSFTLEGRLMGFTIDYIDLLEQKTSIEFEIVEGTWEKNLHRFKNGEVDLITAISFTKERTEFTRYTEPYYIIPTVVYIREGTFQYNGIEDLKGKTVGIETDIYYKRYLQEYQEIDIKEIEDTHELMQMLSFGEIDAVVTNINIGNYMIQNHMLENLKLAGRIDIPAIKDEDLRIGVRRELDGLHSLLQAGINQISPGEYKDLQDRWVGFSPSDMLQEDFLPAEYELIKEHTQEYGGLRLSGNKKWYPIDFLNAQDEHEGIAADIFSLLSEESNIPFVYSNTESDDQGFAGVIAGEADIIPAVVPDSTLKEEFDFTKPYLSLPLVLATRKSEIFIKNLSAINNKRVSYVKRGELSTLLERKHPHLEFVAVDSAHEGLQRVQNGQDFAFIGTIPSISYAIQNHGLLEIKISGTIEEELPISAGVKKGNDLLLSIVQKGLHSIPLQQRERVVDDWISVSFEERVDYTIAWWILAAASMAVLLSLLWIRKVKLYNARISEAYQLLESKNQELEKLSTTDKLTGIYNRSKLETDLELEVKRFHRQKTPFSIIMLDIDHFKSINDNYGHTAGDNVLNEFASRLQSRIRATDVVGRWGGEEFLVLCPGTEGDGARKLAEDIRQDIQDCSFELDTELTVSAGIASYTDMVQGVEELVNIADNALYKAKETRNAVVVF
ncbi:MAG: transporter substrate-binding domain-containing protein [Desulfonatronovibrio sp.]